MKKSATNICPICKRHWLPWANSNLQCHYRCLHTPTERAALLARFESSICSVQVYAAAIDMKPHILTAVLVLARKERLQNALACAKEMR